MEYVPDVGDIVWLTLDPTKGHEQSGRRPAFILTPKRYNARVGLAVCCPITSVSKGYPFEVPLDTASGAVGVVLADQIKSVDWIARGAALIGRTSADSTTLDRVRALLKALLATP
jgi:mRNA interferase MazF